MTNKAFLICLLGTSLILGGCASKGKKEEKSREIPVRTAIAGYGQTTADREYVGVMEEEVSASISFPLNGTIERMYAVEGQQVAKGALLAQLNTSNLESSYAAAKAMLAQAEDGMERMQMLYDNESAAEIKYIEMQTELEKARSMEAIAKKNLDDSRLTAPFSGIIGRKGAEAGENVLPNQTVYTLLKIDQTVMIKVSVPEKEISRIRLNQPAEIKVAAIGGERFEGVVAEKGVMADPISHTYNIRIKVNNPEMKLLPGMVCNVTVRDTDGGNGAIVVAGNAIHKSPDGGRFVWRVVDGSPVRQPVQTGKLTSAGVEIISGLSGGEEIITEGYQSLYDGATIRRL